MSEHRKQAGLFDAMEREAMRQLKDDDDYYEPPGFAWVVIVICVAAVALFALW